LPTLVIGAFRTTCASVTVSWPFFREAVDLVVLDEQNRLHA